MKITFLLISIFTLFSLLISCSNEAAYEYRYHSELEAAPASLDTFEILAIKKFSPDLLKNINKDVSEEDLKQKFKYLKLQYSWGRYRLYVDDEKKEFWVIQQGAPIGDIRVYGPYSFD